MSNVATRKDLRDAVHTLTVRLGAAVALITVAAGTLILAH